MKKTEKESRKHKLSLDDISTRKIQRGLSYADSSDFELVSVIKERLENRVGADELISSSDSTENAIAKAKEKKKKDP